MRIVRLPKVGPTPPEDACEEDASSALDEEGAEEEGHHLEDEEDEKGAEEEGHYLEEENKERAEEEGHYLEEEEEESGTWSCKGVCDDAQNACPRAKWPCCGLWTILIAGLVLVLLICSLETIDSTQMGIAYNSPQATLSEDMKEGGLHSKPSFGHFILWPRTHQTLLQSLEVRSKDGIRVSVQVAFQYTVSPSSNITLHGLTRLYKDFNSYKQVIKLMSRSAIRNACMQFTAMQFQTQRAGVQARMGDVVTSQLSRMTAIVRTLQLTNIDRPAAYEAAVDFKENARNQIELVTNRKSQDITSATTLKLRGVVHAKEIIDAANTAASITLKNAQSEAAIIYGRYASQGALYKTVREGLNLTSKGLLSYIATRLVDELDAITVGLPSLAKVAYSGQL